MSVINQNLLLTPEGYQISRSVRLRSSASAYFNRTPASATNRKTWTWSGWVKRGKLGAEQSIFGVGPASTNKTELRFQSNDTLLLTCGNAGSTGLINTTAVFRDPSAWYHVALAFDTTQAISSNRAFIYINGVLQATTVTTALTLNGDYNVNSTDGHWISGDGTKALANDCYLTEVNFIDGQALTPASFGETDAVTGVWKPKKYAGTYGTNGFYLNFSDNSAATAAAIGKDYSGNGNNWTPNNISVTAGLTYDSMLDVPTMWADSGNGRGNYAVWNPLGGSGVSVTDGNLKAANSAASYLGCFGSILLPSSGKFYFEVQLTANSGGSNIANVGIAPTNTALSGNQVGASNSASFYCGVSISINGSNSVRGSAGLTTDVFQVCYDAATGNVFLGINNTFYQSSGASGGDPANGTNPSRTLTAGELAAWMFGYQIGWIINFGQRPFAYTPPTGFKALNTQNLPDATIKKGNAYFDVSLYSGTGSSRTVTNSGFQPDFVWGKTRSNSNGFTYDHFLYDAVRGATLELSSNTTAAEVNQSTGGLTAFNSNGFTVGTNTTVNGSTGQFVAWQWKESASAGFDIVTYQANGSANRAIAHSLGVAPKFIIVKDRSAVVNWNCWFTGFTANEYLQLNTSAAKGSYSTLWYQTPDSSNFYIGSTGTGVNLTSGNNYVAYLFAEVAGFSKFGSVSMNGSADGAFVFTGFLPKLVMLKRTDSTSNWIMWDTVRNTYNVVGEELYPNLSNAASTVTDLDILSNGFKMRNSGFSGTWIYAAWAEAPFKNSLAR